MDFTEYSRVKLYENLKLKKCIHCGSGNVSPYFAIEQGGRKPHEYWHTIIVICAECRHGQLERTYYDATDWDDILNQTEWFIFDENSMNILNEIVQNKTSESALKNKSHSCPEPLSPRCNCIIHWLLHETTKKVDSLTESEMDEFKGVAPLRISLSREGIPVFTRIAAEVQ